MALYTRRFTNELGNEITVQVKEMPMQKVPSVLIYIAGPDSETESIVTRQEAVEILEGLYKVLKVKKR